MIKEGLELMVVGMGVVSSFLLLLVVLMKTSGYLFNRNSTDTSETPATASVRSSGAQQTAPESNKAAIAVAVATAYRHQRNK